MPKELSQALQHFLEGLEKEETPDIWAFTVYLTYPPSSASTSAEEEEAFDQRVRSRFQSYIEAFLYFTVEKPSDEKIPLEIEYIRLPSSDVPSARTYFRAKYEWPAEFETGWNRSHEHHDLRHAIFVVIDEETLITLFEAPEPIKELPKGERYWAVTKGEDVVVIKVVQVDYNESCEGIVFATMGRGNLPKNRPFNITFYGYMKTTPRWLMEVWGTLMLLDFKNMFKGKDVVYKG